MSLISMNIPGSISEVRQEASRIKGLVRGATNNKQLQIAKRRSKQLVKGSSSRGIKSDIRKVSREEYRQINREIRAKKRQIRSG